MANLTNEVIIIVSFSIIVQFCVDRVKEVVGEKVMAIVKAPIWAIAFGIMFALMFHIDFFTILGYEASIPLLSQIITGLILSSGSSVVHELVAKLRETRE